MEMTANIPHNPIDQAPIEPQIEGSVTATGEEQFHDRSNDNEAMTREQVIEAFGKYSEAAAEQTEKTAIFDSVAELAADPKFADMGFPDFKDTGVTLTKIQKWGYPTIREFKTAVLARKQHKDVEAGKAAKLQDRADRNTAAEAHRSELNKNYEEARAKRDKGTKAVKNISYREKLLKGGQWALDRDPKLAEEIHTAAIDKAEEAGEHVDHLKKPVFAVKQNKVEEERQARLAKELREFDSKLLQGPAKLAAKEVKRQEYNAKRRLQRAEARALREQEHQMSAEEFSERFDIPLDVPGTTRLRDEESPEPTIPTAAATLIYSTEVLTNSRSWARAREAFGNFLGSKKRKLGLAIGAVALTVVGLGTAFAVTEGGNSHAHNTTQQQQSSAPASTTLGGDKIITSSTTTPVKPSGTQGNATATMTGHTEYLSSSPDFVDTISSHALQELVRQGNVNPSQPEIMAATQHLLDLNHLSWDQARHLANDTAITVDG